MKKLSLWLNAGEKICIFPDDCLDQLKDTGKLHKVYQRIVCPDCGKMIMIDEAVEYKYCPLCGAVNIAELKGDYND